MLQAAAQTQIEGFNLESWLKQSKLQGEYVSPVLRPFKPECNVKWRTVEPLRS